ncbi:glycosyl transferase family 90 [Pedobacter sp. MR22-3]|uniref:glycosyl transferase family 90 n=1 Tax=Pedobacter sp. MR22-3 TaxID=2994552 RepID=UPI00224546B5|nr:glycosyl transferase family 90 [Pedobacter sp. MR22-3]
MGRKCQNQYNHRETERNGNQASKIFDFKNTYVDDYKKDAPYFTMTQDTRYRDLIYAEGNNYSAQLKFLFYSQRIVFLQEMERIIPLRFKANEHYIPVKNDLSDLAKQYYLIKKDSMLYKQIKDNALKFAKRSSPTSVRLLR